MSDFAASSCELPLVLGAWKGRFQRLCEDLIYVKFGQVHSVNVMLLLI